MNIANELYLGKNEQEDFTFQLKTFQRHLACFGSSGSGKTVLSKAVIEELARNGIPSIILDPQGDLASLGIIEEKDKVLDKGVPQYIYDDFCENVEVVIWTPASSKGIPLSINPLKIDNAKGLTPEDRMRLFSAMSKNICTLIGYDLRKDEGKSADTILSMIFEHVFLNDLAMKEFNDLAKMLSNIPDSLKDSISTFTSLDLIKNLSRKINILTLGSRKLLFESGIPASIDSLLGKDGSTNKTRISVIYLNSLQTKQEKEFFIAGISDLLYRWMIDNPIDNENTDLQCAFFIDEIAPYIPPVKVPSCKENLEYLFRQGRKYGVGCLIATQSPGDIDYKAIGQFSSYFLGTLNTKQDIEKVKKRLESVAPNQIDLISKKLPSLKPRSFMVVSPDEFSNVQKFKSRWLITKHTVVPESMISSLNKDYIVEHYNSINSYSQKEIDSKLKINNTYQDNSENIIFNDTELLDKESTQNETIIKDRDLILIVEDKIKERKILNRINRHLRGSFIKVEKLVINEFLYLPLIKVKVLFLKKEGWFQNKKINEIPENLYLNHKNNKILHVVKNQFTFNAIVDQDPNLIKDIDNFCTITKENKKNIDFDFRTFNNKKINKTKIKQIMERKYNVNVKDIDLLLFPTWNCKVQNIKTGIIREFSLDTIFGNIVNNN